MNQQCPWGCSLTSYHTHPLAADPLYVGEPYEEDHGNWLLQEAAYGCALIAIVGFTVVLLAERLIRRVLGR